MLRSLSAGDYTFQKDFALIFNVRNKPSIIINLDNEHALIRILEIIGMNKIIEQPSGLECEQYILE